MKKIDWEQVEEAKDFKKVPAGGYVVSIEDVEDVVDKEYLIIYYDIAEGEFKGHYRQLAEAKDFWAGKLYRSYKDSAKGFFKSFLVAVKKSNAGFVFNNDEKELKGKLLGLVLGEEEYLANDGTIKQRLYVVKNCSVESIKNNKYEVPPLKKLVQDKTYDNSEAFAVGDGFAEADSDFNPF